MRLRREDKFIGVHSKAYIGKTLRRLAAIDGCEIGCAKAILEHAEVPIKGYLILTGLGIAKNKDFNLKRVEIDKVKEALRKSCGESLPAQTAAGTATASCCS